MKIQIESSTSCNAKCVFCPRYEMKRKMGIMSDDLFYKIVKEAKELKINKIYPFLNGEPFIFPKIWKWLDYLKENKISTALYTNAEFIDTKKILEYPNINIINCSVNAATKETYDKVVRGPDFNKVENNVKKLLKNKFHKIKVSMVVNELNVHEIDLFKQKWGNKAKIEYPSNWAGARHSSLDKKGKKIPCIHLLNSITVLWDGRVCLCCFDYDGKMILGDLNKEKLSDVIKKIDILRDRHRKMDFDIPLCKKCNYNVI